jgi:hypothetical protein
VWGGVALLLLVLLVGSFLLSRGSIEETEQEAERRAEALAASVLFDQLTTDVVVGDILGPDYRELIIAVQAGILSDDRVAQVRIWKTDGDLIFSTAQGDKITEYVAKDNPQIQRAAEGETNSLLTGATVAAKSGLEGSNEQLLETFVPLHLANELSVSGVVQIDQRYEEIRAEALSVWRPVQIAVAFLLPAAILLLVLSIRRGESPRPSSSVHPREPAPRSSSMTVPSATPRSGRRPPSARARGREPHGRDGETPARGRQGRHDPFDAEPGRGAGPQLRASEAEREQYLGELQLLRTQLGERDAEVATLREGVTSGDAAMAERPSNRRSA